MNMHTTWTVEQHELSEGIVWCVYDEHGVMIADRLSEPVARLIAAAPDVLQALQAIGANPEGYCFCFDGKDHNRPEHEHTGECRAACAAIAKAEGRS